MDPRLRGDDEGGKGDGEESLCLHPGKRTGGHALYRRDFRSDGPLYKHREGITKGFAHKHGALRIVWYEMHGDMEAAILREKRIKKWNRDWKLNLIEQSNPEWVDLAIGLGFEPLSTM